MLLELIEQDTKIGLAAQTGVAGPIILKFITA
jgi:hypothetical protein